MTNATRTISVARFGWPLFAALLLLLFPAQGRAQSFPALTGRVVDQAELLSPEQEQAIAAKSEALETASGRQFVVATVKSLEGYEIRDYGYRLGRSWGIGTTKNDGVVLLVAPNERQVTIEVGYGLEPVLTDALSSIIIRDQIIPWFKQGDMPGGIVSGADAILAQLSVPAAEAEAYQQEALAKEAVRDDGGGSSFFSLLFWIIVIVVFLSLKSAGSRGRRHRGGHGPVVIWGNDWGSSSRGGGGWSSGSSWGGGSSSSGGSSWGGGSSGGFSGGGGSFGGGGASGSW